jgi:hypothetical protein
VSIARYIANPVEVEAVRFDGTEESVAEFARHSYAIGNIEKGSDGENILHLIVKGGPVVVRVGDWVVRLGVSTGFFQVHGPDDFARLYNPKPEAER